MDSAHARLQSIIPEVLAALSATETEADTRLKVIDRILVEVLGWDYAEIHCEESAGSGFADYSCSINGRTRLVVEAKRDARTLGVDNKASGVHLRISGPGLNNKALKGAVDQAIEYAAHRSCELGVVTNGREWVVFRPGRLADGIPVKDGQAFVFPSLDGIAEKFELFYSLLARDSVKDLTFRPHFQDAEGQPIRSRIFSKALRPPGSAKVRAKSQLPGDLDRVLATLFQRLAGEDDKEMIGQCFVESSESKLADTRLARIAQDLVSGITSLDTGTGKALRDVIERSKAGNSREFVLLVGTKGSGKSTYIKRFFDSVLPKAVRAGTAPIAVDLRTNTGDISSLPRWLSTELLKALEMSTFPDGPTFDEIKGMFFDEYRRKSKGALAPLYNRDIQTFNEQFGMEIERRRLEDPSAYISGLLRHIVNSRKQLPVVVIDNADHFDIEFQQATYQFARSIYEDTRCLVIMPITDRTSWQLAKHGALQSFEHTSLFLPTPSTGEVIRKRIQFLESKIESDRRRGSAGYFVARGVTLSLADLDAFARTLQKIFLDTPHVSSMVGELSNFDVRRTLDLIRKAVSSPHLRVADLITSYVTASVRVPTYQIERALIRQNYESYPSGQNDFVQNIFGLDPSLPCTPLLGLRILQLLNDVPDREGEGKTVDIDEIRAYLAGMVPIDRPVDLWLDAMLKTGLILNYDPTVTSVDDARQIEISPSGQRHLSWGAGSLEYVSSMAEATPLLAENTYQEMRGLDHGMWAKRAELFIEYLLREDAIYCVVPEHLNYESQKRISASLKGSAARAQTLAECASRPRSRP